MGRTGDRGSLENLGIAYGNMLPLYLGWETVLSAVRCLAVERKYSEEELGDVVHGRGNLPLKKRLALIGEILFWIEQHASEQRDIPNVLTSEMRAAINRLTVHTTETVLT